MTSLEKKLRWLVEVIGLSAEKGVDQLVEWVKQAQLHVPQGQITFDSEGQDAADSRYFSRMIHWPGGSSGVTLGRGYDMKDRTEASVNADLVACGLSETRAAAFAKGASLSGTEARDFVTKNRTTLGEITLAQQRALFLLAYAAKADYAEGFYGRVTKDISGAPAWSDLHPAIRDVAVDFAYQGTSKAEFRAIAENDIDSLIRFIEGSDKLMTYEPNRQRITYLQTHR